MITWQKNYIIVPLITQYSDVHYPSYLSILLPHVISDINLVIFSCNNFKIIILFLYLFNIISDIIEQEAKMHVKIISYPIRLQ